jgi:hypothetical protein
MAALDPAQRSTEWDVWAVSVGALMAAAVCYRLTRR